MEQPERVEHTKRQFRQSLLVLMQQKPANKITIKELTELAGYDRTTFYRYYQDIYDLVEVIQRSILAEIQELMNEHPEEEVKETPYYFIRGMFAYSEAHKEDIMTLFPNQVSLNLSGPILEILQTTVFRNIAATYPDADETLYKPYFYQVSGGFMSILGYWLSEGTETLDEISDITTRMVLGINRAVLQNK